jgi:hypothetical protein
MDHLGHKMTNLSDYFTDAEIERYKSSFLKKYFKKDNREQGKAQKLSRQGKRFRSSTIKECLEEKRQGNGKAKV